MRYRELLPPPPLRPFVRCLWLVEDGCGEGELERVLPDGCVEIVVHYREPLLRRLSDGSREAQPRAVVAGQLRSATQLESTGPIGMVGARFQPFAASPFLRESLGTLTARVVPLDEFWGSDSPELQELIASAPDDDARFRLLSSALEDRLLPTDDAAGSVRRAVQWIVDSEGSVAVAELARRLQWSPRRLERHFVSAVGLSPKSLCRISRFQQVVRELSTESSPGETARRGLGLADLALRSGYADQAHLARDFKSLAGLSVTAYLAEQHALSDSFALGSRSTESDVSAA